MQVPRPPGTSYWRRRSGKSYDRHPRADGGQYRYRRRSRRPTRYRRRGFRGAPDPYVVPVPKNHLVIDRYYGPPGESSHGDGHHNSGPQGGVNTLAYVDPSNYGRPVAFQPTKRARRLSLSGCSGHTSGRQHSRMTYTAFYNFRDGRYGEGWQRPTQQRAPWKRGFSPPVENPFQYRNGKRQRYSGSNYTRASGPRFDDDLSTAGGYQSPARSYSRRQRSRSDSFKAFTWHSGMLLAGQYEVLGQLGEGTFGKVLHCRDRYNPSAKNDVAVKIVQDVSRYTCAARIEAKIMEEVTLRDRSGTGNCVCFIKHFLYDRYAGRVLSPSLFKRPASDDRRRSRSATYCAKIDDTQLVSHSSTSSHSTCYPKGIHACIVVERLGMSLYSYLSANNYLGFFLKDIQTIARESLKALLYLERIRLVHTDLKPENILLVDDSSIDTYQPRAPWALRYWDGNASDEALERERHSWEPIRPSRRVRMRRPRSCAVKFVDFGSATFVSDAHGSLISTRQYRAPEVILRIGWSLPSDMWSLGCILMELYTGTLLFPTHDHLEHLAMMTRIVGSFPQHILEEAFQNGQAAKYLIREFEAGIPKHEAKPLFRLAWPEGAIDTNSINLVNRCRPLYDMVLPSHRLFASFLEEMLRIDPAERIRPADALQHQFLNIRLPER